MVIKIEEKELKEIIPLIKELKEKNENLKNKIREIQNTEKFCNKCIYGNGFGCEDMENKCKFFVLCAYEMNDYLLEDIII